ncbi:NAD-dependent epimerase/dehydratase family protein [Candidatus Woesearchaeota archaeon]|nr:NAD-dependent epimerase/dehydratase family protein [Candidatus Woesearchaeota archaeon]
MKILVTGGAGLIGSACCKLALEKNWDVIVVDNNMRGTVFGEEASTKENIKEDDIFKNPKVKLVEDDIRNKEVMTKIIKDVDAVIHSAAQPSHPRSLEIPMEDFQINAYGTLLLLESVRKLNPKIPFAFMSTNKVYGDQPNFFKYKIVGKRYENPDFDSFDEMLPIDRCGHTPFGVSKTAADLYCQEYGINYGLKTATFRGGCLTGKASKAVELHGYLPYIIKCALTGKKYTIFGGGYRVRDQIHSSDVASALFAFIENPKPNQTGKFGEPYNLGGCRQNSISIFETIDAIEAKTGKKLIYEEGPERESDHIWWISNMDKFKADYPDWKMTKDLDFIFNEIIEYCIDRLKLDIKLKGEDYFKRMGSS